MGFRGFHGGQCTRFRVVADPSVVGHVPYNLAPRDVNKGFEEVTGADALGTA